MMLGRTAQSCSCLCRCLQQRFQMTSLVTTRAVHHNNTPVFERLWPIGLVGKGKQPRIKKRNRVLIIQHPQIVNKNIKCILTEEVENVGFKGAVVEVTKRRFRSELYPKGLAVYASPENLAEYEKYSQTEEAKMYEGIDIKGKGLMRRLSGLHLRIPMSNKTSWELNKSHIRVACRLMGLMLNDDSILLPEKPVTQPGEITFNVRMDNVLQTQVRATLYLAEDNEPIDPSITFPEVWGNPPVNKDTPVQLVKLLKPSASSADKET